MSEATRYISVHLQINHVASSRIVRQRNADGLVDYDPALLCRGARTMLASCQSKRPTHIVKYMKIHVTITMSFPNGKSLFTPRLS